MKAKKLMMLVLSAMFICGGSVAISMNNLDCDFIKDEVILIIPIV